MTTAQLYAVYCRCYQEFDRELGAPAARGASRVESIVAEFAAHDAQNGTPLRGLEQFERAVATGIEALGPLGLRAAQPSPPGGVGACASANCREAVTYPVS